MGKGGRGFQNPSQSPLRQAQGRLFTKGRKLSEPHPLMFPFRENLQGEPLSVNGEGVRGRGKIPKGGNTKKQDTSTKRQGKSKGERGEGVKPLIKGYAFY
jgi:hypothetical protein